MKAKVYTKQTLPRSARQLIVKIMSKTSPSRFLTLSIFQYYFRKRSDTHVKSLIDHLRLYFG